MSKQTAVKIGKGEQGHVTLDVARLLVSRLLVTATSGGGKSWLLRKILEQVSRSTQTIVIDPEGEFSSLRELRDMVLVGPDGDIPADPRSAGLLCRRLMETRVSAVLDIYELTPANRRAFVAAFLTEMVNLPKSLWTNCFVAIDETHEFAPNTKDKDYVSSEPMALLFSKGRKRGFCPIIATQRLSKLSMDVAAEAKNRCIGQTVLDVDQRRAADYLGWGKDRWPDLRDLSPPGSEGEFFGVGPAFNHRGVFKFRAGMVETTHPEPGQGNQAIEPPKPSKAIAAVLAEFNDLPQQAEEEIRELSSAKQKITTLERDLRAARKTSPDSPAPQQLRDASDRAKRDAQTIRELRKGMEDAMKVIAEINARGFEAAGVDPELVRKAVQSAADQIVAAASKNLAQRQADFERLKRDATKVLGQLQKLLSQENVEVKVNAQHNEAFTVTPTANASDEASTPPADVEGRNALPKAERAILDALVWLETIGVPDPVDGAVAFVAGYSPTSTGYTNPRGQLRLKGLIEYAEDKDDVRRITAAGRAMAVKPTEELSNQKLQARILAKLPKAEEAILRVLIRHYPKVVSNEVAAKEAGYSHTSTGYTNPRGRLRTLGLVDYQSGGVVAKSILFPQQVHA